MTAGLRYFLPAVLGREQVGHPTAADAPPLNAKLVSSPLHYVWPSSSGTMRGISLAPIWPSAPTAALQDLELYAWLALADAIRLGEPRMSALAKSEIGNRFRALRHEDHGLLAR